MKAIVLAFTLKNQEWNKISKTLKLLRLAHEEPIVCIHGFMPLHEVEKNGYDTCVVDRLEDLFGGNQINMYRNGVQRELMAEVAQMMGATVHVIGEVRDGVAEEVKLYEKMGLPIITHQLNGGE